MASKTKSSDVKEKKTTKKVAKPVSKPAVKTAPSSAKPKTVIKPIKKETVKAEASVKVAATSASNAAGANVAQSTVIKKPAKENTNAAVSVNVVGIDGKVTGKVSLPGEIFGEKVNKALLAQAVRVYLANQRQGNASTKTRGEVEGSTRKIFRQKGTGKARHGSIRAPIFVKGGIVFGPKPRDFSLALPQKMKRKALFSALSAKVVDSQVTVLSGLSDIKPKTKVFVEMLKDLGIVDKKRKLLFVTPTDMTPAKRAGRNIQGVNFIAVKQLNAYEVLRTKNLILARDAIDEMKEHFFGKDK